MIWVVKIVLLAGVLLGTAYAQQSGLPPCSGSYRGANWTNCFGNVSFPDGDGYIGEWQDGKPHRQGTFTFSFGAQFVGEVRNGKMGGFGTFTLSSGIKYIGVFGENGLNGQGSETFPDGRQYVGEFRDGHRNGQGTFTFADGVKFVGAFKDDKPHGQGVIYNANGSVQKSGTWENGSVVSVNPAPPPVAQEQAKPVTPGLVSGNQTEESNRLSIEASKKKCAELGFKLATEKFGTCVLRLSK